MDSYTFYKILTIGLTLFICAGPCSAQNIKVISNNSFEHAGTSYDKYSLRSVMEFNPEALEKYDLYINVLQNTHRERLVGGIMMVGGGIATYYGAINYLEEKTNETLAYVGLAGFLIGSGLVIASSRPKQHILDGAIEIYNDSNPPLGMAPYFEIGVTAIGVGAVYQF